jgi:uncharacterized membrane protein
MSAPNPSDNLVSYDDPPEQPMPRAVGRSRAPTLLHRGLIGAGGVLMVAAFGADYAYYRTALWQWANLSAWLITAGLIVALVAVLLALVEFVTGRASRLNTAPFFRVCAAALLSLVNAFMHSRDAWASVVPQGILLSAVSAVLLLIAGARGRSLAIGRGGGVRS